MKHKIKKIVALAILGTALLGISCFKISQFQNKAKNEIRIQIDRGPNTLNLGQAPDAQARKILPLIFDLGYRLEEPFQRDDFKLYPAENDLPVLHFTSNRDELARALSFLSGHTDVLFDSLSLSRTRWLKQNKGQVIEARGYTFSYLGFQNEDPFLKNPLVREAIAHALPIDDWIRAKYFLFVEKAEGAPSYDPKRSNELLGLAGFPRQEQKARFKLLYVTTPVREGNEMASLVREALGKVGIDVEIRVLETTLYYQRLKHSDYQLFASRMNRNSDSDSLEDGLGENGKRNYLHYSARPSPGYTWKDLSGSLKKDLPLIPLFTWKHAAVLSNRIDPGPNLSEELDDSFRFLSRLRLKPDAEGARHL